MGVLKTYTISTDITGGVVNSYKLTNEIKESGTVTGFVGISTSVPLDELMISGGSFSDESALDTLVQSHVAVTLDEHKYVKNQAIDIRTGELIALGFSHPPTNSRQFSLSETAQLNLIGVEIKKNDQILPLTFNNIDNTDTLTLTTPAEVGALFMAALGTKKAHLDSGTALKDQVRAAVDFAAVDTIVDTR